MKNPKKKNVSLPVEKHDTAAWANIYKTKEISNVTVPQEFEMLEAKEWVDYNQK
ncbi:MAG: hypothetical protein K0R71_378 [Bacillales bacterium]|jgi:hypothetical protein|nr:hypothetical protein [Bacillales bacterium]